MLSFLAATSLSRQRGPMESELSKRVARAVSRMEGLHIGATHKMLTEARLAETFEDLPDWVQEEVLKAERLLREEGVPNRPD